MGFSRHGLFKVVLRVEGDAQGRGSWVEWAVAPRSTKRIQRPPGQEIKGKPHASEANRIFQDLEINFGKLLLVYFMRPPRP